MTPAIEHTRAVWEYVPLADVRVVWEALSRGWRPLRRGLPDADLRALVDLECLGYTDTSEKDQPKVGRLNLRVLVPLYSLPESAMKPWKQEKEETNA